MDPATVALIICCVVLALLLFCWRRRCRQRRQSQAVAPSVVHRAQRVAESVETRPVSSAAPARSSVPPRQHQPPPATTSGRLNPKNVEAALRERAAMREQEDLEMDQMEQALKEVQEAAAASAAAVLLCENDDSTNPTAVFPSPSSL